LVNSAEKGENQVGKAGSLPKSEGKEGGRGKPEKRNYENYRGRSEARGRGVLTSITISEMWRKALKIPVDHGVEDSVFWQKRTKNGEVSCWEHYRGRRGKRVGKRKKKYYRRRANGGKKGIVVKDSYHKQGRDRVACEPEGGKEIYLRGTG